jgi:hypothetical protein
MGRKAKEKVQNVSALLPTLNAVNAQRAGHEEEEEEEEEEGGEDEYRDAAEHMDVPHPSSPTLSPKLTFRPTL